uniref:Uncharacterized protein n=1 Tax=Plectus sambesii TaxID=2011161 RepID=A0A914VZY3_9BILA
MHDDMRDSNLLIADLNDALAITESGTVQAKSGFSYLANMQECMMRLQVLKVSQGAIGQVINTVQNCLFDISDETSGNNIMHQIVASINNLMLDCAATQIKFNSIFDAWRRDCLSLADSSWNEFTVAAREQLSVVNTFFCTLHLLANLADKMEESMEILESAHANTLVEPESCLVITLIRDIAKMFSQRSASKYGIYEKWMNFLPLKEKEDVPYKLVTGPLWQLAKSDIHILDMGGQYMALIEWLGANIPDPSRFLNGVPPTSPNGWKTVVDLRLNCLIADQNCRQ